MTNSKQPTFSIITINYNNKNGLEKTIKSVVEQTCKDYEYIIIDGGSTDGSKELIEENQQHFNYWVSEPDKGIYNAMNKGIKVATGDYCIFLNAGDTFYNQYVVSNFFETHPTADIITGIEIGYLKGKKCITKYPPVQINTLFFVRDTSFLAHQSTFIKRELLIKQPYNEDYKLMGDTIFFFEQFRNGSSYQSLDFEVANFDMDGASTHQQNILMEEKRKYFTSVFSAPIYEELRFYAHYDNLLWDIRNKTFIGKITILLKKLSWFISNKL